MNTIIPLGLTKTLLQKMTLQQVWSFYMVNRLCGEYGGYLPKKDLELLLEEHTGKSSNTVKRWLRFLKNKGLIKQSGNHIIPLSKYKLAKAMDCTGRRSVRVVDITDYTLFKSTFILAFHRYMEDGYYQTYYEMQKWIHSQGNLTAAEVWAFPDDRKKVGCGCEILASELNLSYRTCYDVLKGKVKKQRNLIGVYSPEQFKQEFDLSWFKLHPNFHFRRWKKGIAVLCQISSKSLWQGNFNVSKDRFYHTGIRNIKQQITL